MASMGDIYLYLNKLNPQLLGCCFVNIHKTAYILSLTPNVVSLVGEEESSYLILIEAAREDGHKKH